MAYFEDLAAELDTRQSSISFTKIVSASSGSLDIPFEVALKIPDISAWQSSPSPKNDVGEYISKLTKWMDAGVEFEPAKECCPLTERYLLEGLRFISGKKTIEMRSMLQMNANPSVIFTVNNQAVGFQKSMGVDSTYGLRDVPSHDLWSEVISGHNFYLPDFWAEEKDVVLYELKDSDGFIPVRPAITAFKHKGRWKLDESTPKAPTRTPLKRAALTMRHDDIVKGIDKITRKLLESR